MVAQCRIIDQVFFAYVALEGGVLWETWEMYRETLSCFNALFPPFIFSMLCSVKSECHHNHDCPVVYQNDTGNNTSCYYDENATKCIYIDGERLCVDGKGSNWKTHKFTNSDGIPVILPCNSYEFQSEICQISLILSVSMCKF